MQKEEKFKNSPDVRAYMARIKREYRAKHQKQKAKEALPAKVETSLTCTIPEGKEHDRTMPQ